MCRYILVLTEPQHLRSQFITIQVVGNCVRDICVQGKCGEICTNRKKRLE